MNLRELSLGFQILSIYNHPYAQVGLDGNILWTASLYDKNYNSLESTDKELELLHGLGWSWSNSRDRWELQLNPISFEDHIKS